MLGKKLLEKKILILIIIAPLSVNLSAAKTRLMVSLEKWVLGI